MVVHLTIDETAARLGVHRNTVRRMRADGRLESTTTTTTPRGRVLIVEESVARLEKIRAAELGEQDEAA